MKKSTLLRTTAIRGYRPSVRLGKHGHPMRDPEGHGGNESQQTGNNGQGNSGESSNTPANQNNSGQTLDLAQFWQQSEGEGSGTPRDGESAGSGNSSSGTPQQNQGQEPPNILQQIQGLNLGKNIMSESVAAELAEGKTEGFHNAMNQMAQQTVESTVRLMVPLLQQMRDSIYETVRGEMQGTFTNRDNDSELVKAIPSAADPAVRPTVDNIFKRAMTLTKGDRSAAIQMTKDMLKLTNQKLEPDLGLAPRSAGDSGAQVPSNVNWLEELTGRS